MLLLAECLMETGVSLLCGLPFDPSCEPQSWIPSVDFVRVFESSVIMTFIPRCCTGVKTAVSSGVQPLSPRQVKSAFLSCLRVEELTLFLFPVCCVEIHVHYEVANQRKLTCLTSLADVL